MTPDERAEVFALRLVLRHTLLNLAKTGALRASNVAIIENDCLRECDAAEDSSDTFQQVGGAKTADAVRALLAPVNRALR